MNIKKIQKIKKTSSPQKNKLNVMAIVSAKRETLKKQETEQNALTIQQHSVAIRHYLKHFKNGINLSNAMALSLGVDKARAETQLSTYYLNGQRYMDTDEFKR